MKKLLDVKALAVGNADGPLIEGLNLSLKPGEVVGLIGPSGCGKTTLLKTIAGLANPLAGRILFLGKPIEHMRMPTYRRLVTYVNQTPIMIGESVLENLKQPFTYACSSAAYDPEETRTMMDALALSPTLLDQQADTLSGGQMQRISLLRALLVKPAVLLLDEPTSSLDEDTVHAAEAVIEQFTRREGGACMIATHNTLQAERICSSIIDIKPFLTTKARLTCKVNDVERCDNV